MAAPGLLFMNLTCGKRTTVQISIVPYYRLKMEYSNQLPRPAKVLSDTNPLYVAIEAKDIKDAICVHLLGVQAVQHDDGRLGVATILSRRRGRGPITRPVASSTTSSHRRTHATTFISIALIVSMVTTSLRHKRCARPSLAKTSTRYISIYNLIRSDKPLPKVWHSTT